MKETFYQFRHLKTCFTFNGLCKVPLMIFCIKRNKVFLENNQEPSRICSLGQIAKKKKKHIYYPNNQPKMQLVHSMQINKQ